MPIDRPRTPGQPIRFTWRPDGNEEVTVMGADPVEEILGPDEDIIEDDDTFAVTASDTNAMSDSLRDLLQGFSDGTRRAEPRVRVSRREAPEPQGFKVGDLVRATTSRWVDMPREEFAIVDYIDRACGARTCTTCEQFSLTLLRPSPDVFGPELISQSVCVSMEELEHVTPDRFTQSVRCDNADHVRRAHSHIGDCESPVRVIGMSETAIGILTPFATATWAQELEASRERRQQERARFEGMRSGQRYHITGANCGYYGYIARLRSAPDLETGLVSADAENSDGYIARRGVTLNLAWLGPRFHSWHRGNQPPPFIRFAVPTRYSGTVTVEDREVVESLDEHECDHACFDYGCTAINVSAPSFHDRDEEDDDMEPEEHIGDIPIMPYNYRPELTFSGDGPVFLGTELELSCGYDDTSQGKMRRAASLLTSDPNVGQLVILKGDGSISGHGFEAVFHPMSYDWILENWPEDLLRRMRHAGAMPHSSCGMHVHVSRTGFSNPVHAYKWLKFMYRNAADMSRMARRNPSDWGSFGRPTERAAAKWHAKGGFGAENRYTAVNCMNEHTYEVRIFASTLNRTRFLGSLGLVDASIEYTRQLSTQDILQRDGWTFDPFRDYVTSFKKYAPVSKEMARLLNR